MYLISINIIYFDWEYQYHEHAQINDIHNDIIIQYQYHWIILSTQDDAKICSICSFFLMQINCSQELTAQELDAARM